MNRYLCLEAEADDLLRALDRDPGRPHYSEDSFRRKLDASRRRDQRLPEPANCRESAALLESEWEAVRRLACLTHAQEEVVAMRLEGHTFEQIGEARGHSKQGAQNVFFQATKKLVRCWMEYSYRGLHQVYREEVRRRGSKA
jgi:hypothetical protein